MTIIKVDILSTRVKKQTIPSSAIITPGITKDKPQEDATNAEAITEPRIFPKDV